MKDSSFAVIIDEAHSSQAGDSAAKLKIALGNKEGNEEEDLEELIVEIIKSKQFPKNVSFYAFTATHTTSGYNVKSINSIIFCMCFRP